MDKLNIRNVLGLLAIHYHADTLERSEPNEKDRELVEGLKGVIEEYEGDFCDIQYVTTLAYDTKGLVTVCSQPESVGLVAGSSQPQSDEPVAGPSQPQSDEPVASPSQPQSVEPPSHKSTESSEPSSEGYQEPSLCRSDDIPLDYKKKAVGYWEGKRKKRSLDNVKRSYSRVTSSRQLFRWKKEILDGGSRSYKLTQIEKAVTEKFDCFAVEKKLIVHDVDLRKWALFANLEIKLHGFVASSSWCEGLKKKYGIVERKNTKYFSHVSRKQTDEQFHNGVLDFVVVAQEKAAAIGFAAVFNTDQSGCNYELHAGRSLAYRGTKDMSRQVRSVNATTHSFTVQPLLSAAGEFVGPLYVVLQERYGAFGDRVQEDLWNENGNLLISASSSGNVHKVNWKEWLSDVYFPNVGTRSLLILDSYTTQANMDTLREVTPDGVTVDVLVIPPKATAYVQPLDVYGFRNWKQIIRKFHDRALLEHPEINLPQRNSLLKFYSLLYNQFCHERFQGFRRHSWYMSGYLLERGPDFVTPLQYCFQFSKTSCSCCEKSSFVRCSWCENYFCFEHFYIANHYHQSTQHLI